MNNLEKINNAYILYFSSDDLLKNKYRKNLINIIGTALYFYAYKSKNIGAENASEFYINSIKKVDSIINNYALKDYKIEFSSYLYSVFKKLEVCFIRDDVKRKKLENATNLITFNESNKSYNSISSIDATLYRLKEKRLSCNSSYSISVSYNLICLYVAKNYRYLSYDMLSDIVSFLPIDYKIKLVSLISKLNNITSENNNITDNYDNDIKKSTEYHLKKMMERIDELKAKERSQVCVHHKKNIDYYTRMHRVHLNNAIFHKKINYKELSEVSNNNLNSLGAYITTAKRILKNTSKISEKY